MLHVEEELQRFWLYFNVCSGGMFHKIGIISKRWVVANVFNFAVAYSRAFVLLLTSARLERVFVLLDVCRA